MELTAGKLSEVIYIGSHQKLVVHISSGSIKLFMKGEAGIKICFFSSLQKKLHFDLEGYSSFVFEAFENCALTYELH